MKKRPNECLFCTSRKCYTHIYSSDGGKTYNEIACQRHVNELYEHSDKMAAGVLKRYCTSTGTRDRREMIEA